MSQALYLKWRPKTWDQVKGQEPIIQTLRNAVAADRVAHAYLFAGPRGTGKTTTARLLAKAVNCLNSEPGERPCDNCAHCISFNQGRFLDLIEIDAASNTSVDDVRDLREKINFSPNQGRFKVYIVDEVHMLSTAAFNALLKTLEEPPPHAIFVLATTEVHKIPATVLSRCQRHEFRRIPVQTMKRLLEEIADEEDLEIAEEALTLVSRQATGSLRDAISLLDQLGSFGGEITLKLAQDVLGTAANTAVIAVVDAILSKETAEGLQIVHQVLDGGADPRQFGRQMVDYLRNLMLQQLGSEVQLDASIEIRALMAKQVAAMGTAELLRLIQIFNRAVYISRGNWQPGLPLELALVEAIEGVTQLPTSRPASAGSPPAAGRTKSSQAERAKKKSQPRTSKKDSSQEDASKPDGVELASLREQWREVREVVRRENSSTEGLLNSCTVLEVRGNLIILGFASETVKSIMEKGGHLEVAQQGLKQVMGREMTIKCVIATDSKDIPIEIEEDGMVAAAIRLGGEIVHSRDIRDKQKSSTNQ